MLCPALHLPPDCSATMPLSRLSARSRRTSLSAPKSTRTGNKGRSDGHSNYLALWKAIEHTRAELDLVQKNTAFIDRLFNQHIMPAEQQLTATVQDITDALLPYFNGPALDTGNKSLLGLWITENLTALQDHPFANTERTQALNRRWLTLLDNPGITEHELSRLAKPNTSAKPTARAADQSEAAWQTDRNSEESFHQSAQRDENTDQKNTQAPPHNAQQNGHNQSHQSSSSENAQERGSQASTSFAHQNNTLCIDKLFRQLAKVLHPDREQEESAKAHKHELMSQCLQARHDKDIDTLLRLYCEYVGEIPEDLGNESQEELISQLRQQLKVLQSELRQLKFGDPLQQLIIERYSANHPAESENRIKKHAQSLQHETRHQQHLLANVATMDGLQQALLQRRMIEQDKMAINELTGMA